MTDENQTIDIDIPIEDHPSIKLGMITAFLSIFDRANSIEVSRVTDGEGDWVRLLFRYWSCPGLGKWKSRDLGCVRIQRSKKSSRIDCLDVHVKILNGQTDIIHKMIQALEEEAARVVITKHGSVALAVLSTEFMVLVLKKYEDEVYQAMRAVLLGIE